MIKSNSKGPRDEGGATAVPTHQIVTEIVAEYSDPPLIVMIDKMLDQESVDALHQCGDCFVSLAHSEGFGLCPFEAVIHDKPVIITGWGGQLDYLDPGMSMLVDFKLVDVVDERGKVSYYAPQRWAEPNLDHAVAVLREVYRDPEIARGRAVQLGTRVRERFSEDAATQCLLTAIQG